MDYPTLITLQYLSIQLRNLIFVGVRRDQGTCALHDNLTSFHKALLSLNFACSSFSDSWVDIILSVVGRLILLQVLGFPQMLCHSAVAAWAGRLDDITGSTKIIREQ